jgi:uncharacterized protein YggE
MLNKQLGLVVAVLAVGAIVLSACSNAAVPAAQAQTSDQPANRTITVVGQGQSSGAPDVAHVNIGVETTGASAQEAVNANKQQMSTLLEKLKALGVADKDIQTSNYSIYTERPQPAMPAEGGAAGSEGVIYHVSNQVNVTIRDTSKLGDVLDQAVSAGANTIYGVNFEVSDPSQLEAAAREKAIADAKARAESLAQLSGVNLGEVLTVSEVIGTPGPIVERAVVGMGGGGGTPIQPGETQVNVSVQVTYAIK